jgi:hypothetical protein
MPDETPSKSPEASARFPNVDRLIDLGSGKSPDPPKEPGEKPLWKLLLQLRPFLPYLARLVPMLEFAVGPLQNAGMSSDVRKAVAQAVAESTERLESSQRDLSAAVTAALENQSLDLKRIEEELTRIGQLSEKFAAAQVSLAEDLKVLTRLIRVAAIGGAILLVALIVMGAVLLTRVAH